MNKVVDKSSRRSNDSANKRLPSCGATKKQSILALRRAVTPQYQRPWRWGMKNPHSTYYVNVLKHIFPCMVYVNTMRDLDVMVRTQHHLSHRVREAERYGLITEEAAGNYRKWTAATSQRFYGHYLRSVNGGLDKWLEQCMPGRYMQLSLQRIIMRAAPAAAPARVGAKARQECFDSTILPLLRMLRVEDEGAAINATRQFLASSRSTVMKSLGEASQRPLSVPWNDTALDWPHRLEVPACRGAVRPRLR